MPTSERRRQVGVDFAFTVGEFRSTSKEVGLTLDSGVVDENIDVWKLTTGPCEQSITVVFLRNITETIVEFGKLLFRLLDFTFASTAYQHPVARFHEGFAQGVTDACAASGN